MKRIAAATTALALLALAVMSGCQPPDAAVALSGDGLVLHLASAVQYDAETGKATVELVLVNYGPDPILVDTDLHVSGSGRVVA